MRASYAHTNLVARDLDALIAFYREVFGYEPVGPPRELTGDWFERGTGIAGARARVQHLRLSRDGPAGPTLELFEYSPMVEGTAAPPNRAGYGHIALAVDDVGELRARVLAAGGSTVGSVETIEVPGRGPVTWTYVRDPEGNIIELQRAVRT